MLKLTLTPKQLEKKFRDAVLAPYLKAYSKKKGEDPVLTPDDVFSVTIDSDGQTKLKELDDMYIYSAADTLRGCVGDVDIDVYLKKDRPPPPKKEPPPPKPKEEEDKPKREEKLPVGARVEIHGLTSAAGSALNGLHGHIETWHEGNGRYDVKLEQDERVVSCKPANVSLTAHSERSAGESPDRNRRPSTPALKHWPFRPPGLGALGTTTAQSRTCTRGDLLESGNGNAQGRRELRDHASRRDAKN